MLAIKASDCNSAPRNILGYAIINLVNMLMHFYSLKKVSGRRSGKSPHPKKNLLALKRFTNSLKQIPDSIFSIVFLEQEC